MPKGVGREQGKPGAALSSRGAPQPTRDCTSPRQTALEGGQGPRKGGEKMLVYHGAHRLPGWGDAGAVLLV